MLVEWIIVLLFGVFMGNFATSAIFRLPRNIPVLGIKKDDGVPPHCSSCGHNLRMWEYFPVIGWMMCLGRCRYCKVRIPSEYFLAEITVTICSVIFFLKWGLGEPYIISVLIAMALIILLITEAHHSLLPKEALFALSFLAVIQRLLITPELFPIMLSGLIMWIIGIATTRNISETSRRLSAVGLYLAVGFLFPLVLWVPLILVFIIMSLITRIISGQFRLPLALIASALVTASI